MPSSTASLFPSATRDAPATPLGGWVTAHTDGGARGNPGPAGYGVVVADESGAKLAELSEFLGVRSNNVAEYSALLGALEWAEANGRRRLRVVSDSELMVKQIQGKYKVASPDLRPLYDEAKRRIGRLDGFSISHALRGQNKAADRLANLAMDKGMGRTAAPERGSGGEATPSVPAPRPAMLRGFVRGGSVHLLGGASLPDGIFVKVIPEE